MSETKRSRILIVDDDEHNLRLLKMQIEPLGYDVFAARTGEEALDKAADAKPDVILLDAMLPGIDGFEVTRRIKADEDTRIIPIVMISALQEVDDRVHALEAGVDDFLTKPVEHSELKARIRSLLQVKDHYDCMRRYQQDLKRESEHRAEQLKQVYEKLKAASLDTIYRLSRAAEYKDEDTGAHIQRMSQYAAAITRRLRLDPAIEEAIMDSCPMHDIGKLGIPDRILLKPSRLDEDEWQIMQQHTLIGARILEGSDTEFVQVGGVIALTHHEKWDGTGYPRGIRGTEIPIAGRITAIADVFDALTSKRPYKNPYSVEDSLRIIAEGRGTHFDPDVADAFFAVKDEILAIRLTHQDDGVSPLYSLNLREFLSQR
jgi:putative two-component system response regulator